MEKYTKIGVYVVVILLLFVGSYFAVTSLSIIGKERQMFPDMVCEEPIDCYNAFINMGFPVDELDSQLAGEAELICSDNVCGVQRK